MPLAREGEAPTESVPVGVVLPLAAAEGTAATLLRALYASLAGC